jgi:hypothetical protein
VTLPARQLHTRYAQRRFLPIRGATWPPSDRRGCDPRWPAILTMHTILAIASRSCGHADELNQEKQRRPQRTAAPAADRVGRSAVGTKAEADERSTGTHRSRRGVASAEAGVNRDHRDLPKGGRDLDMDGRPQRRQRASRQQITERVVVKCAGGFKVVTGREEP